ncbi:MAG: virion core protein, T7 gp14 family [Planctomycetota bacterium]|jgi:hypothetical protein
MCYPAIIGAVIGVAGGLQQASGQKAAGKAQEAQLKFEADQAERNAQLALEDVDVVQEAAGQEQVLIGRDTASARGEARTTAAAGNVLVDDSSAAELDAEIVRRGLEEQRSISAQRGQKVKRLQTERESLLASAQNLRKAARQARRSGSAAASGTAARSTGQGLSDFSRSRR